MQLACDVTLFKTEGKLDLPARLVRSLCADRDTVLAEHVRILTSETREEGVGEGRWGLGGAGI